jgi:hypothetical protein
MGGMYSNVASGNSRNLGDISSPLSTPCFPHGAVGSVNLPTSMGVQRPVV